MQQHQLRADKHRARAGAAGQNKSSPAGRSTLSGTGAPECPGVGHKCSCHFLLLLSAVCLSWGRERGESSLGLV